MSARPAFQQEQPGVGWTKSKETLRPPQGRRKRKLAPAAPSLPAAAQGTRFGQPAQVHLTRPGPERPSRFGPGRAPDSMPH